MMALARCSSVMVLGVFRGAGAVHRTACGVTSVCRPASSLNSASDSPSKLSSFVLVWYVARFQTSPKTARTFGIPAPGGKYFLSNKYPRLHAVGPTLYSPIVSRGGGLAPYSLCQSVSLHTCPKYVVVDKPPSVSPDTSDMPRRSAVMPPLAMFFVSHRSKLAVYSSRRSGSAGPWSFPVPP